jgi:endonuclease/exonuclease/phosphatase (EEP) superfamily protein YafD
VAQAAFALLAQFYLLGLFTWLVLFLAVRDRTPLLFALNSFAVYLFVPLPLAVLAAWLAPRPWSWALWGQVAAAAVVWAALFGALFVPRTAPVAAAPEAPRLRVLTANLLGFNDNSAATIAGLRAANADVLALHELNPVVAAAIQSELSDEYPYQVLEPHIAYTGGGVISRYPLRPTGDRLGGAWLGTPQMLEVDVNGRSVTLVSVHAPSGIERVAEREAGARALAAYAAAHTGPLIVAGDMNATGQNRVHDLITRELADAWETAGWGLGHTFPGADGIGSSRPRLLGFPVPKWLIRIDFVFYSRHLLPLSATTGPSDAVSDHRPVLVDFALIE